MAKRFRQIIYLVILASAGVLLSASYTMANDSDALVLIIGGTTLVVVPLLWWGPELMRSSHSLDERFEKIHYRSGWYSYLLLSWVVMTYVGVEVLSSRELPVQLLLTGFICVTIAYGAIRLRLT